MSANIPTPAPRVPLLDGFLHPSLFGEDDSLRRARLHVRFGVLGGGMGIIYSAFFFLLGHALGGFITAGCGLAFLMVPFLVHKTGNLSLTGHLYGAVLVLGVAGICAASGGPQGPFSPWLASIPVFSLLLMARREAIVWTSISLFGVWAFAYIDLSGAGFLEVYPPQAAVSFRAASQAGFASFLVLLGLLFEQARIEAFRQMRLANQGLANANVELSQLNQQKNEFLNIAAHDLKNPLTLICGYADLLRDSECAATEQIRTNANEILRSGNHMLDIIQNILEVRRIEDGRDVVLRRRCSIQPIIAELIDAYSGAAAGKEISIHMTGTMELPDLWADPTATRQILDNLLSNALKYTPQGGKVVINSLEVSGHVVVEVSDTGPGLDEDDQFRLWGKFQRLTPRPTNGESSNGLGLWIVRQLTEAMDGSVFCHSICGRGSTFGVRLPVWNGEEASVEPVSGRDGGEEFRRILASLGTRTDLQVEASEEIALPR